MGLSGEKLPDKATRHHRGSMRQHDSAGPVHDHLWPGSNGCAMDLH
jgi:hypothetical protein